MLEKTDRIVLQCTPDQKKMLREIAKSLGLTLSGYMMFCAFERIGERLGDRIASAAGAPSCAGCLHECVDDQGNRTCYPCDRYQKQQKN